MPFIYFCNQKVQPLKPFCLMQQLFTWFIEGGPVFMSILTVLLVGIFFAAWKAPRWVKEIGVFALVFGFLSMILGISQVLSYLRDTAATQSATSIGDLIPLRILFSGLKVTLIPTIYGSIIYLISLIVRVIQKPRL